MRGNFRLIFSDNIIRTSILISTVLIAIQSILVMLFYSKLPPLIPFLNSRPWGVGRLFDSWVIFLVPVFLLSIFIFNNVLSAALYRGNSLMARILSFNALLFIILSLLAFLQILLLVF